MKLLDAPVFKSTNGFVSREAINPVKKTVNRHPETTIVIETTDTSLELTPSANLLDALIDSGHEIDYQCRGGYCGACRTTALSGEVVYDELPLAHLNHDEILPCCCRVKEPLKLAVPLRKIDRDKQGDLFESFQ